MATHPILYSFRRCPYAMRARMGLVVSNIVVEIREIDLKNKPDSLREASPKSTVPTLVLPNGAVIAESLSILQWALLRGDPEGWAAFDVDTMGDMLSLIGQNDEAFVKYLKQYKYYNRFPEASQQTYRQAGEGFLKVLEKRLQAQPFLFADHLSLADIALFPFVRQFSCVDPAWWDDQTNYPKLAAWIIYLTNAAVFQKAMIKYPVWDPHAPCAYFPAHFIG